MIHLALPLLLALSGCAAGPAATAAEAADTVIAEIRSQMIAIPAGQFLMGSQAGIAEDELPVREVSVRAFRMSRFEVTAGQYATFAAHTGRTHAAVAPEGASLPAINVSWDDAQEFIVWLNALSGERYRLPSESEWEYAARAGSAAAYWWGDAFAAERVNGTGIHGQDRWLEAAPVGQLAANPFGLYDMLGNVWEWTADCYLPDYTGAPADGTARVGEPACGRVLRGGSWSDTALWLRTATRNWFESGERFDYIGFRLAHDQGDYQ